MSKSTTLKSILFTDEQRELYTKSCEHIEKQIEKLDEVKSCDIRTVSQLLAYSDIAIGLEKFGNLEQAKYCAKIVKNFYLDYFYNTKNIKFNIFNKQFSSYNNAQGNDIIRHIRSCFDILARNGDFESFLIAIEWNKRPELKFYLPRRRILLKHNIIQSLQDLYDGKINKLGISMPPRTGKAQPLTANIVTNNGYCKMGDIKIGDNVATKNGSFTKVIGIFPQGEKDVYKITFSDGTSTECCKEHLWTVQTRDDRRKDRKKNEFTYRTLELQDIMKSYKDKKGRNKYILEYCEPVEFEKKELKLEPYLMGALIGDGSFIKSTIRFSNSEKDIIEKVSKLLPKTDKISLKSKNEYSITTIKNSNIKTNTSKYLDEYNLIGLYSYEKFIPKEYLLSSINDRIELLRGLFDTDGYCDNNSLEYTTTSKQLKNDVEFLVQSLGGKISCVERETHYTKNNIKTKCKNSYRMAIYMPKDICLVSSNKHLSKYNVKREDFVKTIDNIEFIGKKYCQCIKVEHESELYLTDNFIVTHNTGLAKLFILFNAFKDLNEETFCVSYGDKVIKKFYKDILNFFENKNDYRIQAIFHNANIVSKNADDYYIDIDNTHPYPTFAFSSLYGANTGTVEAKALFYADDLVKDFMEANNPLTLQNTWNQFISTADDRALEDCPYLLIGTMWGTDCPLSRFYDLYRDDPMARFLQISCYDENGKSNFLYDRAGTKKISFSTAYWKDKEMKNDPVIFSAKYLAKPISREGRDFEKLLYYTELPKENPDFICSGVDVAVSQNGDNYSAPILYVYENERKIYVSDVVYSNKGTDYTLKRTVDKFIQHKVEKAEFEEKEGATKKDINYGIADTIKKMCAKRDYKLNINGHSGAGLKSKNARIGTYRTDIAGIEMEEHYVVYFKDKSLRNSGNQDDLEYNNFIFDLRNYSSAMTNQVDDAPDSLVIALNYCVGKSRKKSVFKSFNIKY